MDENFVAERIAELRTQMGISARDMSLSMGLADNYINNIENKKSYPSIQGLFHICEYLKVTPKEFFDDENTAPNILNDLTAEMKSLKKSALEYLLGFIREIRDKR